MNRSQQSRQRGQIVIITAVMLVALIGMVGLAIDSGRAYGVRAKLSAAVDAAALAAGRALAIGASDGERLANAQATGLRFYNANFPSGFLGATRNARCSGDP
jgi:Flp pilus assembly protein TadG